MVQIDVREILCLEAGQPESPWSVIDIVLMLEMPAGKYNTDLPDWRSCWRVRRRGAFLSNTGRFAKSQAGEPDTQAYCVLPSRDT